MQGFKFNDTDALRAALLSEIVPSKNAERPVTFCREEKSIWVIQKRVSKATVNALAKAGAPLADLPVSPVHEASCWAEVLPLRREADFAVPSGTVLFRLGSESALLDVAGELLRLGCAKQSFGAVTDDEIYIRAVAPPYYTLIRACDRVDGLRAYKPALPGQENVWVEVGFEHELGARLKPEKKDLVLLDREPPWKIIREPAWQDVRNLIRFIVPEAQEGCDAPVLQGKVDVRLKLSPSSSQGGATLWVLRRRPEDQVEKLVTSLPQEVIHGLLFVSAEIEGEKVIALRSRPNLRGGSPVTIAVQGEAYVQHPQFQNLFLPEGTRIDPPLRRDKVRDLLAPRPDHVVWLKPAGEKGEFRPEHVKEANFEPLNNWVNYVVSQGAKELKGWERSSVFQLSSYDLGEAHFGDSKKKADRNARGKTSREPKRDEDKESDRAARKTTPRTPRRNLKLHEPLPAAPPEAESDDGRARWIKKLREDLKSAQDKFLELSEDLPGDASERTDLWLSIGSGHASLGQLGQAGLCWTRAMWSMSSEDLRRVAARWHEAEMLPHRSKKKDQTTITRETLDKKHPDDADVRLVVSLMNASSDLSNGDGADFQRWIDRHEDSFGIRELWLTQAALSRLNGDDGLGLARTRDRLLRRLHKGLVPDQTVPEFIRRSEVALVEAEQRKAEREVEALYKRVLETERKSSPVEAAGQLSWAYIRMGMACGMARLGLPDRARGFIGAAKKKLPMTDAVHDLLVSAYAERVEQALIGQGLETPLSQEWEKKRSGLGRLDSYKVDRLRNASEVLVPQEELDPMKAFIDRVKDTRGEEFVGLGLLDNRAQLAEEIEGICGLATNLNTSPDERARLFAGAMDFFPKLGESQVIPYLGRVFESTKDVALSKRVVLLERALTLAGHFGDTDLVGRLVTELKPLLSQLKPEEAAEGTAHLGKMLRRLQRLGLKSEASELLGALEDAGDVQGADLLGYRLQLAAARSSLGEPERAHSVHEATFAELTRMSDSRERGISARLKLCQALAKSLGALPEQERLEGLRRLESEQMPTMTDRFNTNSHFCLALVAFVEYLVFGYVGEGPGISKRMRRMLDEEEYLIRRRIHRETMEISQ